MLREEQIDIRRQRAVESKLRIQNIGRNHVFSDYQVTNPASGGQYRVGIRGFEVGDNSCTCPDFRTNTLGTCKHIEAVLASLQAQTVPEVRRRKASVTRPEVYLHYGEQLQLGLGLPPRHSDKLRELSETFFDKGLWKGNGRYDDLIEALDTVPEPVTILSDAMEFMEREIDRRELGSREETLLRQLNAGKLKGDLLNVPLYGYQMRGALFAACRGRCILGDDMGLGKTVQTMAAVELLAQERGIERVLVVAPASVKYQWETEIQKFTRRPVQVIEGGYQARRAQYGSPTFYRLINYETVLRDLDELNAWQPDLIVLDEAQRIKNWEAKTSRAVKKLRSRYALVLTGTPLENKIEELYSIVQFVDDRRLGPAFQFLHDHRVTDAKGKLLGYRNLDKIREKLGPIFLRRTRAEVLKQLPERTDNIVYVEMRPEQRFPYEEQQVTLAMLLAKKYLTEVDRRRIMCCLTNMRMLCNSTFLFDKKTNVSPKLEEFTDRIADLLGAGPHKVVIFSQWEMMQRKTAEVLDRLKVGWVALHGGVPGKDRRALLERFRDDPKCRVFLSTDAGGVGLNLQAADTVINLEVPWNPAVLEQRIARVHRMGQHRPVQVVNFVTRGSIEERVLKTLELKRSLFDGIFAGTSDEVSFAALGRRAFLDTVRELMADERPAPPPQLEPMPSTADPGQTLVQTGVQLLEALAGLFGAPARPASNGKSAASPLAALVATDAKTGQQILQLPIPSPEVLQRGAVALQAILHGLAQRTG
ncbi:helicase Snf2 [Planctomycetaceae bacterium SCGC AG-212-F19]|nr:helicase Snf2 [Planctomycetaceae bacterium SCGC AG-212-F19]